MQPILRLENVTKLYRAGGGADLAAVDGVSFELYPGECLGLIGESGSGKSTVANLIARLTDCTSGRILLDGRDITRLKGQALREVYRGLQMVFQTPAESFDPRRTLGDGVGESLRNRGLSRREARAVAEELLQMCGLSPDFADRYPHQVSGGQCQRAAIARAIAVMRAASPGEKPAPKVLICDEATSALDVTIQREIVELLRHLRQALGLSILFICHDIALVRQFCDRVLVMYRGKIVEEGAPDEVIRSPKDAYTRRLIDSIL